MSAKELNTEQDGLKDIIESYERDLIEPHKTPDSCLVM